MDFTLNNLKKQTQETAFMNGVELYLEGKVSVDKMEQKTKGDNFSFRYIFQEDNFFNAYAVEINLKNIGGKYSLTSCLCQCFYFYHERKICKHIIAVGISVLQLLKCDTEEVNKIVSEYEAYKQNKVFKSMFYTDACNVKLFPTIVYDRFSNKISLKLKIGNEKKYIVNSIDNLVKNIKNRANFRYGKNLEFTHSLNSFDQRARDLIDLLEIVYNSDVIYGKMVSLNANLTLKILQIYRDQKITFEYNNDTYSIDNSLKNINLSAVASSDSIDLVCPDNLFSIAIQTGVLFINDKETMIAKLTDNEMILYDILKKNDDHLNIDAVNDSFMRNIYPRVKKFIDIDDELSSKYPDYEVTIDSYFDYVNGNIILHRDLKENGLAVENKNLAILSLGTVEHYEQVCRNLRIENDEIIKTDDIINFMHSDLSSLKEFGEVFLSERIKSINVRKSPSVNIAARFNVDLLELRVESEMSDEEISAIIQAYHNKDKYVKLRDDMIIKIDEDVKKIVDMVEDYDLDYRDLTKPTIKPKSYIFKFFNDDNANIDDEIRAILNELKDYQNSPITPPAIVSDVLRIYQLEAFRWLKIIAKYQFGGILADDMGLGKTLEILSLIISDEKAMPTLIVCPTSLVYNWYNECSKWDKSLNAVIISGLAKNRQQIIDVIAADTKTVYITSYDSLKRDVEFYKSNFRFIIIDEAQFIKNQNTQKAMAVKGLKSEVNFALTGTPIENSLADLWSIFDFVMPNYLSSYQRFKDRYESLIMEKDNTSLSELKGKITPFVMRRTKKQVLKDLPDKIEEVYYANLEGEQAKLYEANLANLRNSLGKNNDIEILSMLMRLRQICVSPKMYLDDYEGPQTKIDLAVDLINEAVSGGHKVLLFSQFTKSFELISSKLKEIGIEYFTLTGETKAKKRMDMSLEFNESKDVKVFLISLKAGGTGLNLIGADTVIHLDPWWNVSVENQATDRAHRIGQENKVNVIKIVCANTIEQKVIELQEQKAKLASSIISNEGNELSKLDTSDLSFILS